MKYCRIVCLCLICAFALLGCGKTGEPVPAPTAAPTATPALTAEPSATPAPTEMPTAAPTATAVPAVTSAPTVPPAPDNSYTLALKADVAIYQGPGPEYAFVQAVGQDGVYTIVEEAWDAQGELWGRLKSGVGWVNLSSVQTGRSESHGLVASFTDEALMNSGNYEYAILYESSYSMNILLRAERTLLDLEIAPYDYSSGNPVAQPPIYQRQRMEAGDNLVIRVDFPGDMTAYHVSFTDGGFRCSYALSLSGRDGSPWLWEIFDE